MYYATNTTTHHHTPPHTTISYNNNNSKRLGFNHTHLLFDDRPVSNNEVGLGSTFFVDSGVDSTDGRSPKTAFGTIDEAVNNCTAGNGDKIVLMAGHAETISGATGID